MDRAATQNAFSSATLSNPKFSWLDERTLELIPEGLEYASGDAEVVAKEYDYTFTDQATDLNGNPLEDAATYVFSTFRRVDQVEPLTVEETSVQANGTSGECFVDVGLTWRIGQVTGEECRNLMSVDLSSIPAEAIINQATLDCSYLGIVGSTPEYSALEHVRFDPDDLVSGWRAEASESYADPIPFSQNPDNRFSVDIATSLNTALADGSSAMLQLRLRLGSSEGQSFLSWRNNNGGGCTEGIRYTYLVP